LLRVPSSESQPSVGSAFALLYREQFAFVWRMLLHFGVPVGVVEDAVQDVFVVVHRRWGDLDAHVSVRSWLYGISRRVASDHRRKLSRHERKLDALPRPGPDRELEREIAGRQLISALDQALAELDPERREVFVLAEVEGMTAREIAEAVGAKPNTVSSRLRAARIHVSAALAHMAESSNHSELREARISHGRAR
jgi:RNA polymerase sigma-70 factor (ECF subfamily)